MPDHNEHQKSPLQPPSLSSSIEELPLNLSESAIEAAILSEPLGSHKALHKIVEELKEESLQSCDRKAIESSLRNLRHNIYANWNLWPDYRHAEKERHLIDSSVPLDLASWTSRYCSKCFNLLLDCGAVGPASFCRMGCGFFRLAFEGRHYGSIYKMLSLMDPQDILEPYSMILGDPIMSVFQVSTLQGRLFHACWVRLKPSPNNGLSSLRPCDIGNICRFADPPLANDLADSGLDLGKPYTGDASLSWYNAAAQKEPEPMLNWLLTRAEPPEDLLAIAAQNNYFPAAPWIMEHTRSYDGWRKGAYAAADSYAGGAERMLATILRGLFAKAQADRTVLEDLTTITVDRAYKDGKRLQVQGPDDPRLAEVEELAVQKVKVLREKSTDLAVVGLKIKAAELGMHRLEAVLGD
ncbi:hypothetical protein VI817_001842 [Penicillium citrinum]|nr:hypothetical protein VI817_001842 [Penicillium citrinum]